MSPAQLLEINIDCRTREAGMINPGRSEEALTIDSAASHTLLPHTQAELHRYISSMCSFYQQFVMVLSGTRGGKLRRKETSIK